MADSGWNFARLLGAVAAIPELDGLLLLDAPHEIFRAATDQFTRLLRDPDGREPDRFLLGMHLTDDELWMRLAVDKDGNGNRSLRPSPGHLVQQAGDPVVLVVVPDLVRPNMAVRRALVTLLDSPVAHLERHGQHLAWQPRLKWLVGCESAAIGEVSRHVLDRFPLRFRASRQVGGIGVPSADEALSAARVATGKTAREAAPPSFPAEALTRAGEYFPATASIRRVIALSRLARGLARLDATASVTTEHIDEAASLMSLVPPMPAEPEQKDVASPPVPPQTSQQDQWQEIIDLLKSPLAEGRAPGPGTRRPGAASPAGEVTGSVSERLTKADLPVAALSNTLYPEDEVGLAEAPMLAIPGQHSMTRPAPSGPVIGVWQATGPRDLAWVPTLIEAAKFQAVRRRSLRGNGQQGTGLILSPTDLRAYRRSRRADALLVLVLDHTCLRHTDATDLLASYLYWAYTRRAAVTVIEVGAASATPGVELRADFCAARSVQDPAVQAALRRSGGKATPLAHGLELARDALWRASRALVAETWLVVVTDGLGNIPLAASLAGTARPPWAGRGTADAVAAASAIAAFNSVNAVLIAPPRVPHSELPERLAAAMGAGLIRGMPTLPVLASATIDGTAHAP
jgi:magnesium chelatase subunit D